MILHAADRLDAESAAAPSGIPDRHAGDSTARPATQPARLAVRRLAVTRFRSYGSATLTTDGRSVVLNGPNGAGKTNILEALSFLSPGRGLRRAKLSDIDRRSPAIPRPDSARPDSARPDSARPDSARPDSARPDSARPDSARIDGGLDSAAAPGDGAPGDGAIGAWVVAAELDTPEGPLLIGTGRDPGKAGVDDGSEKRLVKLDGTLCRGQQPLALRVALIWLTPQMDRLFLDGASGRRRFLDRLVFGIDPAHSGRVTAYEHAMRERSRLLRAGRADPRWLEALEATMAEKGVAVAAARRDLTERLLIHLAEAPAGAFPVPQVALLGVVEQWLETRPALEAEDRLRADLADGRTRDAEVGGAAIGPHRSDLAVRHTAKAMPAADCSTGEQKALLIALVLANARLQARLRGMAPLLLLDEIAAHLDDRRRGALADAIVDLGAQAWMTGSDRRLFEAFGARAQHVAVDDGRLTPVG